MGIAERLLELSGLDVFGLINTFNKVMESGDPDLDVIDEIVTHDAWHKDRQHGRRRTREPENRLLELFKSRIGQLLGEDPVDYGRISDIIRRPCWQRLRFMEGKRLLEDEIIGLMVSKCSNLRANDDLPLEQISSIMDHCAWREIQSESKRRFELALQRDLEEIVEDFTKHGQLTSAGRRVDLFKKNLADRNFLERLRQKVEDCKKSRAESEEYVRSTSQAVHEAVDRGALDEAELLLEELEARWPESPESSRCKKVLNTAIRNRQRQVVKLKEAIESENLEQAKRLHDKIKTKYVENDELSDLQSELKKAVSDYVEREAGRLNDEKGCRDACAWLDRYTKHYSEYLDEGDLLRSPSLHSLFNAYLREHEKLVLDALEAWDLGRIAEAIQEVKECCNRYDIRTHLALDPIGDLIDQYRTAERGKDLQETMEALASLEEVLRVAQRPPLQTSPFYVLKLELERKAKDWEARLREEPFGPEAEPLLASLDAIAREDRGPFGKRAEERMEKVLEGFAKSAELTHDWPRAIGFWEKLLELHPDHPDAHRKKTACSNKLKEEQELYAEVENKQRVGRLNEALRKAERLKSASALKEKASAKAAELCQQKDTLEQQADALWTHIASTLKCDSKDLRSRLYLLDEKDQLAPALKAMDAIASGFKDSEKIAERLEILRVELTARSELQRVQGLEREVIDAEVRAAPAGFKDVDVIKRARDALRIFPDYVPFKDITEKWQLRIRTSLLDRYRSAVEEKRLHSAVGLGDEWIQKVPGEDIQQELSLHAPDLPGPSQLMEQMEEAETHSSIARTFFNELDYEKARKRVKKALRICADDPVAIDLSGKLKKWETGIGLLKQLENTIDAFERGEAADLLNAQKLLGEIQKLGVTFRELKKHGLRYNLLGDYQEKIDQLVGITGSLILSIVPARYSRFLVFLTDEVKLGNPRDETADVKIRAGGIKPDHARIARRDGAFYLVSGAGECRVKGKPVKRHALAEGDEIQLGPTFLLMVDGASSDSLVLIIPDSNPVDNEYSGLVLMGSSLDLGSKRPALLRSYRLEEAPSLLYGNGAFRIRRGTDDTPLLLNEPQRLGDVSITITRRSS